MCATDSERDDLSELGLLMVSAFAIMSVLLICLLLFLHFLAHELEHEDRHLRGRERHILWSDSAPSTLAASTVSRHHCCFRKPVCGA